MGTARERTLAEDTEDRTTEGLARLLPHWQPRAGRSAAIQCSRFASAVGSAWSRKPTADQLGQATIEASVRPSQSLRCAARGNLTATCGSGASFRALRAPRQIELRYLLERSLIKADMRAPSHERISRVRAECRRQEKSQVFPGYFHCL
jgi:hypothetical protein